MKTTAQFLTVIHYSQIVRLEKKDSVTVKEGVQSQEHGVHHKRQVQQVHTLYIVL